MIYVIGGQKGGTGKTTIATNLAVALARAGRTPLLVDSDHQRTATLWSDKRQQNAELPAVITIQRTGELYKPLLALAEHYSDVIVDAGGHDSVELRGALVAADRLYSPVRASQSDLWTLDYMSTLVAQAKAMNGRLSAFLLLTMAPTHPNVSDTRDALELLAEYPAFGVCTTVIRDRRAYRDATFHGRGVLEMGDPKASSEVESLLLEVSRAEVRESSREDATAA